MNRLFLTFTALIVLSACTFSGPLDRVRIHIEPGGAEPQAASRGMLIMPSNYHGDEVTARAGENWLAVVQTTSGQYSLKQVPLLINRIEDLGDEPGTRSGKSVSAKIENGSALFFMKGISGIAQGPIHTASTDSKLPPNVPLTFELGSTRKYSLCLKCENPSTQTGYQYAPASLVFSRGEQVQVLATYTASFFDGKFTGVGNEGNLHLLWAGDMDSDGNLDLLIDISDHYNMSAPTLFLSKGAPKAKMVIKVAQRISMGC